jgi:outer membrane receptor protein involved in Fe transport
MNISKRSFYRAFLLAFCAAIIPGTAHADVFGRLKISVRNVDNDKPISNAKVVLHDETNVHPDVLLSTGEDGSVTTGLLETHLWTLRISADTFGTEQKQVQVAADTTGSVSIVLEPAETTITVTGTKTIIAANDTGQTRSRDREFLSRFPLNNANPQQLTGLLLTTPGFVQDSANQVHPRGEHSATSVDIQGIQLGGANQGRFGPIIDPRALENVDILTGSFAPEYGSQSGAILNSTIRSGTIDPKESFEFGGGNYGTADGFASAGGQFGAAISAPDAEGKQQKSASYFIAAGARHTDNALEAPQPHNQTAHNSGDTGTLLGKFDFRPTADDTVSLMVNVAPARTDVANRTGLPDEYADFGQGYGFGGALSQAQAAASGIVSQEDAGQDIYQEDLNDFAVLQWRHNFSDKVSGQFSVGANQSYLDVKNDNPAVNLDALPDDSSIEYNPTVKRHANHALASASLTAEVGDHTLKAGGSLDIQNGNDSYQLIPASGLAADALAAADPRLAPQGTAQFDDEGNPVLDSTGNQVYVLQPGAATPKVGLHSHGYYDAAYVQDTWKLTDKFTANYGLRFDAYRQEVNLDRPSIDKVQFSPRLNLAYALLPGTVVKASYNRLFIDPPLSQGSVIGDPISPERLNQFDVSIEQQITSRQRAKVAYYDKAIKNQVDTGLLIPSTQLGIFTSVNLERDHVRGLELSYDLLPADDDGVSAFTAYTYSVAKPSGVDNTGEEVDAFNDHDQRHTVTTGAAYTFDGGWSLGTTEYYGSGLTSSALDDDSRRKSRFLTNISATSKPDLLWGKGGLKLSVENLFDQRERINFNSAFSGTRFEQGRTALLSAFFYF